MALWLFKADLAQLSGGSLQCDTIGAKRHLDSAADTGGVRVVVVSRMEAATMQSVI